MGRKSQYFGEREWLENFGKRFTKLRSFLELSQEEMGQRLDVSRQRICQIESGNGKYPISISLFYKVCHKFRVDPSYLLGLRRKKRRERSKEQ